MEILYTNFGVFGLIILKFAYKIKNLNRIYRNTFYLCSIFSLGLSYPKNIIFIYIHCPWCTDDFATKKMKFGLPPVL